MTIKEFKKDLNKSEEILSVNRTNKSFVNEKESKTFYRIKSGEKVQYLEKSSFNEIEKMMYEDKNIGCININYNDLCNKIIYELEDGIINSAKRYKDYMRFSAIANKFNLKNTYAPLNASAMTNKYIAHKNIEMYHLIVKDSDFLKSENLEEISSIHIEEYTGLLKEIVDGLGESIPKEISSLYKYKELAGLAEQAELIEIKETCLMICDIKKIIIEELSTALNDLLQKIEEHRARISILQMIEREEV